MEQTSPFRVPACPGTPLYQLSPDRINQQRLPPSPSLPNHLASSDQKHSRQSSDVASKIAFLNSLNNAASPAKQQPQANHAALQRAILGREEAEAALSTANSQLMEAQIRERRISERVESLMEELQTVKERQLHERQVFEKEVRRARKDAFKSGSLLVKAQEDLKEARAELKTLKAEVLHERQGKEKSRQEAFERAYTLAGMMEEMEVIKETLRNVEAERDAVLLEQRAKTIQNQVGTDSTEDSNISHTIHCKNNNSSVQENHDMSVREVPKSDMENDPRSTILTPSLRKNRFDRLLPVDSPESTPFISWGIHGKTRRSTGLDETEVMKNDEQGDHNVGIEEKVLDLEAELRWERKLRERADDMVHFLQMECQFKMCACRIAEQMGERFIHDWDYEKKLRAASAERKKEANPLPENWENIQDSPVKQSINLSNFGDAPTQLAHGNEEFTRATSAPMEESSTDLMNSTSHSKTPLRDAETTICSQFDLLEMSPIKYPVPRPATAIGFVTTQSPIRVVPHSPLPTAPTTSIDELISTRRGIYDTTPRSTMTKSPSASPYPITPAFKTPTQPNGRIIQSQTTTTIIPLRGIEDDDVFSPAPQNVPGTPISREAALAQIRARRDRARSVNLKTSSTKSAPGSARRGLGGGIRDISAPGRF